MWTIGVAVQPYALNGRPLKRLMTSFLTLVILVAGCGESNQDPTPALGDKEVIRVPVVVHVIYDQEAFNISDQKVASQIAVLNKDFRKKNTDRANVPKEFSPFAADVGIEFVLASKDPLGMPTTGITRTHSTVNGFDGHDSQKPIEDLDLFFTNKGGRDAWPPGQYLNIWVAEMSDRHGRIGLAGYAQQPGADPRIDGIVIDPRAFGTLPPLATGHALGRTATHEIGHWLSLFHLSGQVLNGCMGTDFVDDTPPTSFYYVGTPTYPQFSCGVSSMFMNFMERVDDEAMCMFTEGQRQRMRAVFRPNGKRNELYEHVRSK